MHNLSRTSKLCAKLMACVSIIAFSSPAFAAMDSDVMAELKAMRAEMSKLKGQVSELKEDLKTAREQARNAKQTAIETSNKMSKLEPAAGTSSKASDTKVTLGPGLKVETADGATSFKVGGFAQVDAAAFKDDVADHPDGALARRARLNISGTIEKDWKYKLEADVANSSSNNNATITDAFVQYDGFAPFAVTVGQFKEPFGLETLTSDLFTSFAERASPTAFSPDRNLGVMFSHYGDSPIGQWTAAAGGFAGNISTTSTNDEASDITGRVTLAPIAEKDKVLHFGVAASRRIPDSATDTYQVRSKAENAQQSLQSVDTGAIAGVDDVNLLGFEAAAVWGPASIQGEYVVADVDRNAAADITLDGYYVEASYYLTGESRTYKADTARFDRTKTKNPLSLSNGGWGSWQVMARHSVLDLNDSGAAFLEGEMSNNSFGVRWQPVNNVAVLLNYIDVDTDANAVTANDDPEIWLLRTQFDL